MWCDIDRLHVCLFGDILFVLCLKYIVWSTDLLISFHVRNNNYKLYKNGYLKIKLQI